MTLQVSGSSWNKQDTLGPFPKQSSIPGGREVAQLPGGGPLTSNCVEEKITFHALLPMSGWDFWWFNCLCILSSGSNSKILLVHQNRLFFITITLFCLCLLSWDECTFMVSSFYGKSIITYKVNKNTGSWQNHIKKKKTGLWIYQTSQTTKWSSLLIWFLQMGDTSQ